VVSGQPRPSAIGKITAVATCLETNDSTALVSRFLRENGLEANAIDAVLMGYNGDSRYDHIYDDLTQALFMGTPIVGFKHLLGEYDTVVAAALAISLRLLGEQRIPAALQLSGTQPKQITRVLIYTQRRGRNHGLLLVEH